MKLHLVLALLLAFAPGAAAFADSADGCSASATGVLDPTQTTEVQGVQAAMNFAFSPLAATQKIRTELESPATQGWSATELAAHVDSYTHTLSDSALLKAAQAATPDQAKSLVRENFEVRRLLLQRARSFDPSSADSIHNADRLKAFSIASRKLEAFGAETSLGSVYDAKLGALFTQTKSNAVTASADPAFVACDANGGKASTCGKNFRSGDVLMVRGLGGFDGSSVAEAGDQEAGFSHLVLVYKSNPDETDPRKIQVVQVEARTGLGVTTLQDILDNQGDLHAVLLRNRDADCAAKAASYEFNRAVHGRNNYDFTLTDSSYRTLSCAEVIEDAYKHGCGIQIPQYRTTLTDPKSQYLRKFFKIQGDHAFSPGDLEFDPRFSPVAEWRDFGSTATVREQDAAVAKIYEWLGKGDAKYYNTPNFFILGHLASGAMKTVGTLTGNSFQKHVVDFPENVSASAVAMDFEMSSLAGRITKALHREDAKRIQASGKPMTPDEMAAFVEDFKNRGGLCHTGLYFANGGASCR